MTDNALKIIKDELARIDEARAKATPLYYTKHQKMKHFTDYLIGVDCCQEEPFVIADMNRNMDNWKHDLEFIALAANEITKLTKALSVAVDDIERLKFALQIMIIQFNGNVPGMTKQQVFDSAIEVRDSSTANITTIANILSGGKDGK